MSLVTYCAGSGSTARAPGDRRVEAFDRLLDNLIEQGGFALRQLERESTRASREVRSLLDANLLSESADGRLQVTPEALRLAEERMLIDLLRSGGAGFALGKHQAGASANFAEAGDEPRVHEPGDPLVSIDPTETIRRALGRGAPIRFREEDIVVTPALASGRCATVILLDLSGSMVRYGKFAAARRAALALRALVRRRFPGDELISAGFATRAEPLPGAALLEARPRDVGLFDPRRAEQRVAYAKGMLPSPPVLRGRGVGGEGVESATEEPLTPNPSPLSTGARGTGCVDRGGPEEVPAHFTNIQDGLRFARRRLRAKNIGKQVVLVTDGEPTAHLEGDDLVLAYPPTEATARHTLLEAARCAREGIAVHVFGLVGEFSPPGLGLFVGQLARAGRGRAVCCSPRQLGSQILNSFTRLRPAQG